MGDVKPAAQSAARVEHVSDLGEAEGDGVVRPDRRSHDLPCVAIDAGGDIQAEDRFTACVNQVDRLSVNAAHPTIEARSEQGVDDPVAVVIDPVAGLDARLADPAEAPDAALTGGALRVGAAPRRAASR